MVGDGVNDAAALALADVGIAVHGGTGATIVAADIVLTREGVAPLVDILDGARRLRGVIRRNIGFSLVYNAGAAALAIAGLVGPLLAAILMPVSSLTVILSSALHAHVRGTAPDRRRLDSGAITPGEGGGLTWRPSSSCSRSPCSSRPSPSASSSGPRGPGSSTISTRPRSGFSSTTTSRASRAAAMIRSLSAEARATAAKLVRPGEGGDKEGSSMNLRNKTVRILVLLAAAVATGTLAYALSNARKGYEPRQPILFRHTRMAGAPVWQTNDKGEQVNVGGFGIPCVYCHTMPYKGRHSTVPSTAVCMNCHTSVGLNKEWVLKMKDYWDRGEPIPWVKVHDLPDFVYYDHAAHVNAKDAAGQAAAAVDRRAGQADGRLRELPRQGRGRWRSSPCSTPSTCSGASTATGSRR